MMTHSYQNRKGLMKVLLKDVYTHSVIIDSMKKLLKPAFTTISALKTYLRVQVADDIPFLLCPPCYSKVYHQFKYTNRCSSCGATGQIRYSPNPTLISQYLTETIGTEIVIGPSNRIVQAATTHRAA